MKRFLLVILLVGFALPSMAARLQTIDAQQAAGTETIILVFDRAVQLQQQFILPSPPRLVIDMATTQYDKASLDQFNQTYRGGQIKALRSGQFDTDTTRFVFDITHPQINYQVQALGNQLKVLLTTLPGSAAPIAQPSTDVTPIANAPVPVFRSKVAAKEAMKPTIVIDAGHGGKDSGARSRQGLLEKTITLQYAHALRDALLRTGRYKVVLTREGDEYLFLQDRVRFARTSRGDMFISLHADANPRSSAQGVSVYTLSETASDEEAAALAQQENKADIVGGLDLSHEDKTVADILIDLAQRETNNKSSRFAELVIEHMNPKIPLIANTHRFAGFRVLKAPDIPSILLEMGFLTNEQDAYRMQTREYRDKLVQSLVSAINAHFN
tara:strand:- start:475 stop:1626 length:1152 start_codon:yes stop_codon:yes gene_type:complete